jgi:hypothetical protein
MGGRQLLAAAAFAVLTACTDGAAPHPCNVAVTAPQLRIDVSAYRSTHAGVTMRVCRLALRAEPVPDCPTFPLDTVTGTTVSMFAPPNGMVVSVTLTTAVSSPSTSRRVGGRGGPCGAYTYPLLRLTDDGRLV